jgi:hypothetical protein
MLVNDDDVPYSYTSENDANISVELKSVLTMVANKAAKVVRF